MRKLPYSEGTWFGVPLEGGGFGVGVVARAALKGKILLAYLFGPKRTAVPTLGQVERLKPQNAVLKPRVADLGLIRGKWPIIGRSEYWQQSAWPMPVFVRREPLGRGRTWLVFYSDGDPSVRAAEECAPPQTTGLGRDSLCGFGAAEAILTEVLTGVRSGSSY